MERARSIRALASLAAASVLLLLLFAGLNQRATAMMGGSIIVRKYEDANLNGRYDPPAETTLPDWRMRLYDEEGMVLSDTTDVNGRVIFDLLDPGIYTVCETLQDGWANSEPGGDEPCQVTEIELGDEIELSFGNYRLGSITVLKEMEGLKVDQDFDFTLYTDVSPGDPGPGELFTLNPSSMVTDQKSFTDLEPGCYAVSETVPFGWAVERSCRGYSDTCDGMALQPGGHITCVFTNTALDSDGDGILDLFEGEGDTDGDGTPDYLDEDSDDDGIPDADEGGGDTDEDGTPDYKDEDSDGDGIPDADEGAGDTDGDGTPDYKDEDSDDDGVPDADEGDGDTDGDGIPDYLDEDSDGDGIPDQTEGDGDRDGDGVDDQKDYDPTGYLYDEQTGQIVEGGSVSVSGTGDVDLVEDGSLGYYQLAPTVPGVYTIRSRCRLTTPGAIPACPRARSTRRGSRIPTRSGAGGMRSIPAS
jgi:hypothetical protein